MCSVKTPSEFKKFENMLQNLQPNQTKTLEMHKMSVTKSVGGLYDWSKETIVF